MATEDFDQAAFEAKKDFAKMLEAMTPEERATVNKIIAWWRRWFMTAGHKRLAGIILGR